MMCTVSAGNVCQVAHMLYRPYLIQKYCILFIIKFLLRVLLSLFLGLSLLSIQSRFAFLKGVNEAVESLVLSMADLRVTNTHLHSTGALLKKASGLMFYDTKMAFLNRALDQSSQRNSANSSPEISLDPLETLEGIACNLCVI